ncbi:MAG: alpha/beta hydrolase-fold protein [Ignavibacteriaceae bacterium]
MNKSDLQYPAHKIIDTTFVSEYVNDSIKVDVSLPSGYSNNHNKYYHILYMTDGYWRRSEHNTIHQMSDKKEIPDVIVVGIGYPDDYDFDKIRIRDLIIHADKLFACIKNEVMPYVENKYRVDTKNRTLWGSSYGGYFLTYALTEHFKQGELFKNYICASPALNPPYKHTDLIKNEKEMWEKHKELPVNLYLTVGGDEEERFLNSYDGIVKEFKSHQYKNFHFEHEIIPGKNHFTVWEPTLLKGLKEFLNMN